MSLERVDSWYWWPFSQNSSRREVEQLPPSLHVLSGSFPVCFEPLQGVGNCWQETDLQSSFSCPCVCLCMLHTFACIHPCARRCAKCVVTDPQQRAEEPSVIGETEEEQVAQLTAPADMHRPETAFLGCAWALQAPKRKSKVGRRVRWLHLYRTQGCLEKSVNEGPSSHFRALLFPSPLCVNKNNRTITMATSPR